MSESTIYFRIPAALSDQVVALVPRQINDDEFAAHQLEFLRQVFAYSGYLRDSARDTPLSDAFFMAVVSMFDTVGANSPEDARRCAMRLRDVFDVLFPASDPAGSLPPFDGVGL